MQWIDALGYEEVMTFLRSTPANLFFKDTAVSYTHLDVYKRQVLKMIPSSSACSTSSLRAGSSAMPRR